MYYASFLVRTWRWKLLLRNAGEDRPAAPLLPILMVSFFVNCVVPAKMGDIYRAYLARLRQRVPGAMALGTIIAERLLDLVVLMVLLLGAGAVVFHDRAPAVLIPYLVAGVAVCAAGIGAILVMRAGRGQRLLRLLPEAVFHRYESFRMGTVQSFSNLPVLVPLTVVVWAHGERRGWRWWCTRSATGPRSAPRSCCSSPWSRRCSPPSRSSPAASGSSRRGWSACWSASAASAARRRCRSRCSTAASATAASWSSGPSCSRCCTCACPDRSNSVVTGAAP